MGTWHTFATELIYDKTKVEEIESYLFEEKMRNPSHFDFKRIDLGNCSYFVGHNKNAGGGFYEWTTICLANVKMVWVSDEGGKGDYGF